MLELLLQNDGTFPFKMVLGQILGMVSDKLDLCKMSAAGNGAGLLGILSFVVYAVFIIVMVIWGAMIIYNIFNTGGGGSSGKREEEEGTTSSGGTSSSSMGLTSFGAAIKKNAAGQIIPIIIWTIVVIVGMATSNC